MTGYRPWNLLLNELGLHCALLSRSLEVIGSLRLLHPKTMREIDNSATIREIKRVRKWYGREAVFASGVVREFTGLTCRMLLNELMYKNENRKSPSAIRLCRSLIISAAVTGEINSGNVPPLTSRVYKAINSNDSAIRQLFPLHRRLATSEEVREWTSCTRGPRLYSGIGGIGRATANLPYLAPILHPDLRYRSLEERLIDRVDHYEDYYQWATSEIEKRRTYSGNILVLELYELADMLDFPQLLQDIVKRGNVLIATCMTSQQLNLPNYLLAQATSFIASEYDRTVRLAAALPGGIRPVDDAVRFESRFKARMDRIENEVEEAVSNVESGKSEFVSQEYMSYARRMVDGYTYRRGSMETVMSNLLGCIPTRRPSVDNGLDIDLTMGYRGKVSVEWHVLCGEKRAADETRRAVELIYSYSPTVRRVLSYHDRIVFVYSGKFKKIHKAHQSVTSLYPGVEVRVTWKSDCKAVHELTPYRS